MTNNYDEQRKKFREEQLKEYQRRFNKGIDLQQFNAFMSIAFIKGYEAGLRER